MDTADLERQTPLLWDGEKKNARDEPLVAATTKRCSFTRQCKSDAFMWAWVTVIILAAFWFQWQLIDNQVKLFANMRCTNDPPGPSVAEVQEIYRGMVKEVRDELLVFRSDLYNVYAYVDQHSEHRYDMYDHPQMIID
jgi:hypothetical protein